MRFREFAGSNGMISYPSMLALFQQYLAQGAPSGLNPKPLFDKYANGQSEIPFHVFLWVLYEGVRPNSKYLKRVPASQRYFALDAGVVGVGGMWHQGYVGSV